jgi:prepilin peptidase CpaA
MPDIEFQYVLLAALAIALVVAAVTDIRRRQIDNWLNAAIALTAPLYWWASDLGLWPGVAWQVDRPPLSGPFGLLVHDRLLRHGWP